MSRVVAWLPMTDGLPHLGDLSHDIEVRVWDGIGAAPVPQDVTFWVPPFQHADYREVLPRLTNLSVVQTMTAGYEEVTDHLPGGVRLANARGVHDGAVSEWVIAAILASLRRLPEYVRNQADGRIERGFARSLDGRTVTILGYGSIGVSVERRLQGFDTVVNRVARRSRPGVVPMDAAWPLLAGTDVLVVLAPLDDSTRGLVDAEMLAALPDGALVVNAARGPVVDQTALAAELASGRLHAALDVTDPDPLPAGDWQLALPGLLYTPHVSGMTDLTIPRVFSFIGDQLRRESAGETLANLVR